MDITDAMSLFGKPNIEVIQWLQRDGLLASSKMCNDHQQPVEMNFREDVGRNDGFVWYVRRIIAHIPNTINLLIVASFFAGDAQHVEKGRP